MRPRQRARSDVNSASLRERSTRRKRTSESTSAARGRRRVLARWSALASVPLWVLCSAQHKTHYAESAVMLSWAGICLGPLGLLRTCCA
jgi:hypothetical protein